MEEHTFNPRAREADSGGSLGYVPGLHSQYQDSQGNVETPCLKKKKKKPHKVKAAVWSLD